MEEFIAWLNGAFAELALLNISFKSFGGDMVESIFLLADKANCLVIIAVSASELNSDFRELTFREIIHGEDWSGFSRETFHINPSSFCAESAFWMETSFATANAELTAIRLVTAVAQSLVDIVWLLRLFW